MDGLIQSLLKTGWKRVAPPLVLHQQILHQQNKMEGGCAHCYHIGAVKHPVFASVKIWAFAHLLTNGALADVLLFGCFLAWAVIGRVSMRHRKNRPVPGFPESPVNDLLAVVVGLLLYLAFIMALHDWLISVEVM